MSKVMIIVSAPGTRAHVGRRYHCDRETHESDSPRSNPREKQRSDVNHYLERRGGSKNGKKKMQQGCRKRKRRGRVKMRSGNFRNFYIK